jgi:2-(1,2-epoxy-1,2-dihydrophenyl)acetyl-CoA isomerase
MSYETISFAVERSVATVTFNRPAMLNAFNDQMIAECISALSECADEKAIRCVVLTGSGRAFSAGQDLKEIRTRDTGFSIGEHVRKGYNEIVRQIVTMQKPVIGAVNGVAAGAGCGIALSTDIRIVSHLATFVMAFSRVGLVPDSGATWTLPRLVGPARAFELAATGEAISAQKALDWGLVNAVVPAAQLPEIVNAWAQSLAQGPTLAYGLTKRAIREGANSSLDDALQIEADLQQIAGQSRDFHEGLRAFVEKRDPEFIGE